MSRTLRGMYHERAAYKAQMKEPSYGIFGKRKGVFTDRPVRTMGNQVRTAREAFLGACAVTATLSHVFVWR